MTLKELVKQALDQAGATGYKLRYYKQSPYQKHRYKPEFVEEEVWAKGAHNTHPHCITSEDWKNADYRDMVIADIAR